jgi:hypothetical protein
MGDATGGVDGRGHRQSARDAAGDGSPPGDRRDLYVQSLSGPAVLAAVIRRTVVQVCPTKIRSTFRRTPRRRKWLPKRRLKDRMNVISFAETELDGVVGGALRLSSILQKMADIPKNVIANLR